MAVKDMKVEVKSYKPHRGLSQETEAFTATIWVDGKRAGDVRNDGQGGPNLYDWLDRELGVAFMEHAEAWGAEHGFQTEPEDMLIAELCETIELRKQARRLLRPWGGRANGVIFVEKDPQPMWEGGPMDYRERFLQVVGPDQEPEAAATLAGAVRWRVIDVD